MVTLTHLLDTNVCVQLLRNKPGNILHHLEHREPGSVGLCTVSLGELAFGAELSIREEEAGRVARLCSEFVMVPFSEEAAWVYGKLRGHLHRSGTPIGQLDLLIASVALQVGLILVTHNLEEFRRVPGLKLEDWQ